MAVVILSIVAAFALASGLWFWWACTEPSSTFFKPVLIRGPQSGKRVALTFDDGPAEPFTRQILDILREHQVPAAFFVLGKNVEQHPDLLRCIAADGHEVGNHSYSHFFTYFKSRRRMAEEIDRTQAIIEKAIGCRPKIFRPPYGARWVGLVPTLAARGMHLILWSATGYDWTKSAAGISAAVLRELRPGAILLLHDGRKPRLGAEGNGSPTVLALPEIIAGARQRGYTFAPLKDFLPAVRS